MKFKRNALETNILVMHASAIVHILVKRIFVESDKASNIFSVAGFKLAMHSFENCSILLYYTPRWLALATMKHFIHEVTAK